MVTSTERFRSAMISSRSRWVNEYRKYQRTQKRMMTSSKCRPRNSARRLRVTIYPARSDQPRLQQNQLLRVRNHEGVDSVFQGGRQAVDTGTNGPSVVWIRQSRIASRIAKAEVRFLIGE